MPGRSHKNCVRSGLLQKQVPPARICSSESYLQIQTVRFGNRGVGLIALLAVVFAKFNRGCTNQLLVASWRVHIRAASKLSRLLLFDEPVMSEIGIPFV
jgi:hypothetical protein